MNGISHQQAIPLIDRRLDGLLSENQRVSLEEHLRACDSCRAYAAEMDGLSARLQTQFHRRWDAQAGPSQKVFEQVTTVARKLPLAHRISSSATLLAGAIALVILGMVINFVISQLQGTSPVTEATKTVDHAVLPADRLLAFASEQNGQSDIYTVRADGSGLTNLTNDPARDVNPYWSPDGERIAFMSERDGFMDLFVMNADGSGLSRLTNNEQWTANVHHEFGRSDYSPWSPDGSRLLFTEWSPDNETWKLYVIGADGQNKIQLARLTQAYSHPSWSSDGGHIAYILMESIGDRQAARIHVIDAKGKNDTHVTSLLPNDEDLSSWNYAWTREGNIRFIANRAYVENDNLKSTLYEATLDGATLAEITQTSTPLGDYWDGTAFVLGPTGETLTWLRSDGTYREFNPFENCQMGAEPQYDSFYKRSPHGYLLFGAGCPNGDWWFTWANPRGTQIKQLLKYPLSSQKGIASMAWSPDDKYIAIHAVSADGAYLYIVNVAESLKEPSTQPVKVALAGEGYSNSSWQPFP